MILIDFDGVIRHWHSDAVEIVENRLALPAGTVFSVAFSEPLLVPTITGQQSHTDWVAQVHEQLSTKLGAAAGVALVEAWEKNTASIDYGFSASIRSIAPKSKLVLVTNATDRLSHDIRESHLSKAFDLIVNSSVIGFAKPESAFFRKSIELIGCNFSDRVFIDDTLKNVNAAREFGIHSLQHESVSETLAFIKESCAE